MDSGQKPELSDYHLTQCLCSGAAEEREMAMGELMRRYWAAVYSIAYTILRSTDAARDVAQTTFVIVLQHACSIDAYQSFAGWIRTVARNGALDVVRRFSRFAAFDEEDDPSNVMWTTSPASPFDHALYEQMLRKIDALPLSLQVAAEPVLVHGEKVSDVAAKLGLTEQAVYVRLAKAKKYLSRPRSRHR